MVSVETEINSANSQGEPKSVQLNCLKFLCNYHLKIEPIERSKCGFKYFAWRLLVWPTQDVD